MQKMLQVVFLYERLDERHHIFDLQFRETFLNHAWISNQTITASSINQLRFGFE